MKSKLVIWGQREDRKVLLALSLRALDNKIDVYVFPEEIATEELFKNLSNDWKNGAEIEFPEGYQHFETELTASGDILPQGLSTDNSDIITRAQTEWQFFVLSARLSASYQSELETIKDKIEQLKEFSQPVWNELKTFWDKVQGQIREKNILADHISSLRKATNTAFDDLKEKRKELDRVFNDKSASAKDAFFGTLNDIEEKISKGLSLHPIFEELKDLQNKFKTTVMNNADRRSVWDKLDMLFKQVKDKRFGGSDKASSDSAKERLDNRYNGLIAAIGKMEQSIQFDKNDLDFQNKKMDGQVGQLELQIRQAKTKMIEERIQSKQAKLNDMLATKAELEQRKLKLERSEAVRAEKEEAKKLVQEKIAAEIKAASDSRAENTDDLEKAAKMISDQKKQGKAGNKEESLFSSITSSVSEALEDAVDTIAAVGSVIGEKLGDIAETITEKASDLIEDIAGSKEEAQEDAQSNKAVEEASTEVAESNETETPSSENPEDNEDKA